MRPNFLHSTSSSISWQQQQRNNNGIPALFPYNQQQLSDEGTIFHRPHLELMNMESLSSPSTTTRLVNYNEEDEIGDHVVVLGRALDAAAEEGGGGGQLQMAAPAAPLEKEHMFDKVVTPSDVGKLNRLVIPKQHAEKYFPLDSSTNEKGLLLNFEDRNGKPWRFRYSYWNSSQSYVMTKGWSRFVKDKKLDAGDIVSFSRGVGELGKDRLFIDWRRRPTAPPPLLPPPQPSPGHQYYSFHPWNHPYFLQQQRCRDHHPSSSQQHPHHQINYNPHHQSSTTSSYGGGYGGDGGLMNGNPLIYFRSPIPQQQQMMMVPNNSGAGICSMMQMQRAGGAVAIDEDIIHDPMVFESVPVVQGKAAAKRLRLFGVNMDCPISDGDASISGDDVETDIILSSTAVHHHDHPPANPSPSPRNFYSSSSSSSSSMRAHPYNVGGPVQQRKMYSDNNKGKGSLSLDFDV